MEYGVNGISFERRYMKIFEKISSHDLYLIGDRWFIRNPEKYLYIKEIAIAYEDYKKQLMLPGVK